MAIDRELAAIEARLIAEGDVGGWLAIARRLRDTLDESPERVAAFVLGLAPPRVRVELDAAIDAAFQVAVSDSRRIVDTAAAVTVVAAAGTLAALSARPSESVRQLAAGAQSRAALAVVTAQRLARAGVAAETIAAPILGDARSLAGVSSDVIARGGGEGAAAVAEAADVPLVWIAETNACVICLALSGTIARPGRSFDASATYGSSAPPVLGGELNTPPRHPFCRCTVEPAVSTEFASTLRREADRSVLRGFSLESESMTTRVQAADRLLERGVDAPKSVQTFARRAVRDGKFPTRDRPKR